MRTESIHTYHTVLSSSMLRVLSAFFIILGVVHTAKAAGVTTKIEEHVANLECAVRHRMSPCIVDQYNTKLAPVFEWQAVDAGEVSDAGWNKSVPLCTWPDQNEPYPKSVVVELYLAATLPAVRDLVVMAGSLQKIAGELCLTHIQKERVAAFLKVVEEDFVDCLRIFPERASFFDMVLEYSQMEWLALLLEKHLQVFSQYPVVFQRSPVYGRFNTFLEQVTSDYKLLTEQVIQDWRLRGKMRCTACPPSAAIVAMRNRCALIVKSARVFKQAWCTKGDDNPACWMGIIGSEENGSISLVQPDHFSTKWVKVLHKMSVVHDDSLDYPFEFEPDLRKIVHAVEQQQLPKCATDDIPLILRAAMNSDLVFLAIRQLGVERFADVCLFKKDVASFVHDCKEYFAQRRTRLVEHAGLWRAMACCKSAGVPEAAKLARYFETWTEIDLSSGACTKQSEGQGRVKLAEPIAPQDLAVLNFELVTSVYPKVMRPALDCLCAD